MTETDGQTMNDEDLREILRSALGSGADPEPGDAVAGSGVELAQLRAGVKAAVAAEDARPLASLRQRPTWQRRVIGFGTLATLLLVTVVAMPRADLAVYPLWRLALELGIYGAAYGLCLVVALRGAHLPALAPRVTYALAIGAIALVGVVGLLPPPHEHGVHVSRGFAELLSPCGLVGVLVALPVYLVARVLDRGSSLSAVAAAAAAGLAGNTFLQMHCANTESAHMLLGHAMVGVWLLLGLGLMRAVERRAER